MLLGECAASVAKTFLESDVAVIDIKQPEPVAAGIRIFDEKALSYQTKSTVMNGRIIRDVLIEKARFAAWRVYEDLMASSYIDLTKDYKVGFYWTKVRKCCVGTRCYIVLSKKTTAYVGYGSTEALDYEQQNFQVVCAGTEQSENLMASGLTASAARGALFAVRILAGQYNPANGIGLANTSLAFFGDRLYALCESDLPYAVRLTSNEDIETIGRHDFDGKMFMRMNAHPKTDPDTKETFAFRYGLVPPFLTYFRFDSDGSKQPDVPIFSMTRPSFLHDFAITNKYAIFGDIKIGMNPTEMIFGGGSPFGYDPNKVPRLGVIPRYAKDESEMRWFNVPGFNILHAINAWEEDDGNTIVMVAPNVLSVEHTLERLDLVPNLVEKVRINLKTGIVTRNPISARNLDFGVINQGYVGKKNKYVYAAVGDPLPKISGVVKLDVSKGERQECIVATRHYGGACYRGEPIFVPKQPDNPEADEDDGYVMSYVHDEKSGESRFLVMDAKSAHLEIVAAVKLPWRVPYGFHGLFVRKNELDKL
ncbi:hypothetical protein LWI29_006256 [Acer saccharum]|uniref:Carotenoid cleavage dioxygenase 4 n=1 Tax=Acer saccharum TaxID=4024 RepID=A0AA39SJE1_ACESA|nr:hypothetical protein LWI29_006256 [Acer saccharum]